MVKRKTPAKAKPTEEKKPIYEGKTLHNPNWSKRGRLILSEEDDWLAPEEERRNIIDIDPEI